MQLHQLLIHWIPAFSSLQSFSYSLYSSQWKADVSLLFFMFCSSLPPPSFPLSSVNTYLSYMSPTSPWCRLVEACLECSISTLFDFFFFSPFLLLSLPLFTSVQAGGALLNRMVVSWGISSQRPGLSGTALRQTVDLSTNLSHEPALLLSTAIYCTWLMALPLPGHAVFGKIWRWFFFFCSQDRKLYIRLVRVLLLRGNLVCTDWFVQKHKKKYMIHRAQKAIVQKYSFPYILAVLYIYNDSKQTSIDKIALPSCTLGAVTLQTTQWGMIISWPRPKEWGNSPECLVPWLCLGFVVNLYPVKQQGMQVCLLVIRANNSNPLHPEKQVH